MIKKCNCCNKEFNGRSNSKYCSKPCFNKAFFKNRPGKKQSRETIEKRAKSFKGFKHAKETKEKLSIIAKNRPKHAKNLFQCGDKNPSWKGGIAPENDKIRNSKRMKSWKFKVFKRDNFTCQFCEKIRNDIEAHHIKPFSKYPKLRFITKNGITLCKKCHKLLHKLMRQHNE